METSKIYHGGGKKGGAFSTAAWIPKPDVFAKVTAADTTTNYLDSKIAVAGLLGKTVINPGANEQLQLTALPGPDIKSKVSAADTTTDYLNSKIVVAGAITKTILNPGVNEQLQLSSTAGTVKRYTLTFGQSDDVVVNKHIPAGEAGLGYWQTNTNGYYIQKASKVIAWGLCAAAFLSYNVTHYVRLQIKTIVADGSRVADITSASGTNLRNYDLVFPYSDGVLHYYKGGGEDGLSLVLNAGEMVFLVCCAITVAQVRGLSAWLLCEET